MALENEVYRLLKEFCQRFPAYSVKRKPKLQGYSRFTWTPDFILEKDGRIVVIIEVKDVTSEKPTTLHTQMRLAFAELCDLHRRYSEAHTLVIVPDAILRRKQCEKYFDLFSSVGGAVLPARYISDEDGLALTLGENE